MADEHERDEQREREVLISDKRHSRDLEAQPADEPVDQPATDQPEPEVTAAPDSGKVVEFKAPDRDSAESSAGDTAAGQAPPPETPAPQPPDDSPEAMQLRMLFEAGLPAYLHSQLQLILNFAMIYLGRHPNPATGLVSTDLDKARLAIDLFDFIVKRTQDELPEQDRAGLGNLISSLKMEYAQAASSGPPPKSPGEA
jgi:hypothetical protein